uniref:Uncharacterized protein n=1 Tax=Ananas comosus var. bracteatus TaxID=296719 RepID=A0A6V7PQ74_ANACO|nr:unnamed protein product [Ananas comosus var. bracteatus]
MAKAVVAVDADYTTTKAVAPRRPLRPRPCRSSAVRSSPTPASEAVSLLGRPLLADLCSAETAHSEAAMLLMLADAVYGVVTSCSPAVDLVPCARGRPPTSSISSSASASSNPDMEAPPPKPRPSMASSDAKSEIQASNPAVDLLSAALMGALFGCSPASSDHKTPRQTLYFLIPDDAPAAADDRDGDDDDYAGDEEEDEDPGKPLELFPRGELISFLRSPATRDPHTLHRTPLSASAELHQAAPRGVGPGCGAQGEARVGGRRAAECAAMVCGGKRPVDANSEFLVAGTFVDTRQDSFDEFLDVDGSHLANVQQARQ